MKFFILMVLLFLTTSNTYAFSIYFSLNRNGSETFTEASLYNPTVKPIMCSGMAYGRTAKGYKLNHWVNEVTILPQTFYNVEFSTIGNNSLIVVSGLAKCKFID